VLRLVLEIERGSIEVDALEVPIESAKSGEIVTLLADRGAGAVQLVE
jgi:hypothetical protein